MEEAKELELRRYASMLLRWWWLILLGPAAAGAIAFFITNAQDPTYQAQGILLVNQPESPGTVTESGVRTSERLARTYVKLITTDPILEDVRQKLDLSLSLENLEGMLDVSTIPDTQLIEVKAEHSDPAFVRDLVDVVMDSFVTINRQNQLNEILQLHGFLAQGPDSLSLSSELIQAQATAFIGVTVAEQASLPTAPIGPRPLRNAILGGIAGLVLAVGVAFLLEYLDDRIKTAADVERVVSLPTLGHVIRFKKSKNPKEPTRLIAQSNSSVAEAYRLLRTNLQFSTLNQPGQLLLVTSSHPLEGKTTTVANLGMIIAQSDKRVIVVDADFRRPDLHRVFSVSNEIGLTNFLLNEESDINPFLKETDVSNLRILTTGPIPPNPVELLGSPAMANLLNVVRKEADVVLFDSPPILAVADPTVLAAQLDGVVVVVDTSKARPKALGRAKDALSKGSAKILGVVLNKQKGRTEDYYYYYYYSRDGARDGSNSGKRSRLWAKLKFGNRVKEPKDKA